LGLGMEDVTGNFLAATRLSSGSLSRGQNLLYTVNSGSQLVSQSNTIVEGSSAIAGLSVTALAEGSTTVEVASDNAKIKTAITDFMAEYNRAQSLIDSQTASSTDSKGKVTAGILAGDAEAHELASKLRGLANSYLSGLTGSIKHLDSLGIAANGNDNTLTLSDSAKLDSALSSNLSGVKDLFTNSSSGLAVQLSSYLDETAGTEGSLATKQSNLGKEITGIDTQISDLERVVLSNQSRLIDSFIAMETARATINQQLQFLSQRFGTQA
jgi:flagellar hook-associated protein 2